MALDPFLICITRPTFVLLLQATSPFHFMLHLSFHLASHDSYKWGHSTLVFGYFGLVID